MNMRRADDKHSPHVMRKLPIAVQPFFRFGLDLVKEGFEMRLDLPGVGALIDRHDEPLGFFSTSPI